jgi:hypothetical protein
VEVFDKTRPHVPRELSAQALHLALDRTSWVRDDMIERVPTDAIVSIRQRRVLRGGGLGLLAGPFLGAAAGAFISRAVVPCDIRCDRFVQFKSGIVYGTLAGLVLFPVAGALIASETVTISR